MSNEKKGLSKALKLFYGIGDCGFTLMTNVESYYFNFFLTNLAQFGYGVAYACTPALYADTIIYSEWKTGKNATGWISGLQNVPLKVGVMTRGIIISACLAFAAFDPSIDAAMASVELKKGICMAFMVIPALALIVAAVLLLFGFRLTKEKVEQYSAEIAARNRK